MSYIKLKVQSGGIYIRQKKQWDKVKFGNLFLYPPQWKKEKKEEVNLDSHPENNKQQVLSLVRDSSLKGLFSYLMGETQKIKKIEASKELSIQKLNDTLDKIVETVAIEKTSEPYITTFFERKDTHRKKSAFSDNPKINLHNHPFEHADPTIRLLKKPLENILASNFLSLSFSNIHSLFLKRVIDNKKEETEYKKLKENALKLRQRVDEKIPQSTLKNGIYTALKRIKDKKPISIQVLNLIEKICDLCDQNTNFLDQIKKSRYGKFSVFTDLNNTKQWIDKKYYSVVRGTPAFIACVNFNIYLSQEAFEESLNSDQYFTWEDIVKKFKQGPSLARWGEGGVVFVDYCGLYEMGCGYETKDQMFVEMDQLKKAGIKIKKYNWEQSNESKTKK